MSTRPQVLSVSVFLAVGLLLGSSGVAWGQDDSHRTVNVSGEGTARAVPDQAIVRFGIVSRAETAEEARSKNATAARNAMNAVRELGIPEEDMRMETLRLRPRREYNPQKKTHEETGFEATRQVVVELDSLEVLPRLIAQVVEQGANRLEGVNYQLSNREAVRNKALRRAAQAAREKAQLLTETLDAQLGRVRQISEQSFSFGTENQQTRMVKMSETAQADAEAEPQAYAAGEIEVSAQVQVVFDLDGGGSR